ncbi:restriction endonuclease subunit S [Kineothrix sp. MSJ-39]|uniref:restriction endonuclease subunit S n=1 Tax=Kineothrix sp. MSJ-39 TaxID=2841533 RepID=UPI001C11A1EE|nr:restriction endonuclease subunit S [Kineothrix sp. MSJ-39]MBU5429711.1 restriction endonuclease subunit S [Kineothrix sp. MSJ-39]
MAKYKLGDICEIVSGSTPKTGIDEYWDGNIKWITPAELNDDTYIINDSVRKITELAVMKTGLSSFPKGTVILSSRAPIGKVAIAGCEMYCNQGFKNLICSDKINSKYLYWFLKGNTAYLNSLGRGATFKEISKRIVSEIEINVPNIEKQEEVVSTLEKISEIIALRKKELRDLDDLIKARFVEMFGDLKSNSKSWKIVGFNECADIDTNMIHDFKGYEDYPHIGIDSIEKETGRLVGYRTIAEDGVISGKYLFTPAHIIYSKIRPNLNKVAMPDFDGLCSADAYPILVKEGICNREYFGYILRSQYFLDYILTFSNRTNLPKVNKSQVEGFTLPLPPIEIQNRFADFVHQVDKSKVVEKNI